MPIVQQGSINTTALIVPDLYVQIVPPQQLVMNGVPTNVVGMVGTATWGPVGKAFIVGSMADYARYFGPVMNRKFDLGTQMATATLQGASNFRCVRATDGTDVAAAVSILSTCLTVTALYTGTLGNSAVVSTGPGSKASTGKVVIAIPGQQPEVYDNIPGTGNPFWVNAAAAINAGNGALRGPSLIVTATAGVGVTAVATASYPLIGGTDGATTITSAVLIGVDTVPRKGMYALRNQGVSVAVLADADDTTQYTSQVAFGLAEGIYMILTGPAGDTIVNALTTKASSATDSYAAKLMFGDWIYWYDQANALTRLVSPQGFVAGRLGNLSPEQSSLNKPIYGVIGTQKSGLNVAQNDVYSTAELQSLIGVGIDVISSPQPGGDYFGCRAGHNSSSNAAISGDNYTRMTNYLAATLNAGMGKYVGQLISADLFRNIKGTTLSFLGNLYSQKVLVSTDGSLPYGVICDLSNNPPSRTGLGYVQEDIQVRYGAINEKFIVNMEGGQTVTINRQTTPAGQIG